MNIFLPVLLFIGGAAGAVSRITGTIGKGLAALTFDDEYQKKRREGLNKKPANIGEGFARGGKGLVMVSSDRFEKEFNEGEVKLRYCQKKHV